MGGSAYRSVLFAAPTASALSLSQRLVPYGHVSNWIGNAYEWLNGSLVVQ